MANLSDSDDFDAKEFIREDSGDDKKLEEFKNDEEHQKHLVDPTYEVMELPDNSHNAEIDALVLSNARPKYPKLLDILFVLDTTGSMQWIFPRCVSTIKKIIKQYIEGEENWDVKFSISLYRDHLPEAKKYLVRFYN